MNHVRSFNWPGVPASFLVLPNLLGESLKKGFRQPNTIVDETVKGKAWNQVLRLRLLAVHGGLRLPNIPVDFAKWSGFQACPGGSPVLRRHIHSDSPAMSSGNI